jgi:hypothetical protein
MGTQHDASRRHTRGQTIEIAIQPVFVEQEGWCCQRADRCGRLAVLDIRSAHLLASHFDVS